MADPLNPLLAPDTQPESLAGSDDLGRTYIARAQTAEEDAAIARWQQRIAPPKPEGEQKPTQPAGGTQAPQQPSKPGTLFEFGGAPPTPAGTPAGGAGVTGKVLSDIAKGVLTGDAVTQIPAGAIDALRNMNDAMDSLGWWLNDHVLDLSIGSGERWSPQGAVRDALPGKNFAPPRTGTGALVRDVSRFLTGMATGGALIKGAGVAMGSFPQMLAAGAFSDAVAREPDSGRLADLLEKAPVLQGPVLDFMRSNPDDPEALKRFKNALEGLALGSLAEGLIRGVRVVRAQLIARGDDMTKVDPLAAARQKYGEIGPQDMPLLGDPSKPAVIVGDPTTGKLIEALKTTETGVPPQVAAKGVTGAVGDDVAAVASGGQPGRGLPATPAGAPAARPLNQVETWASQDLQKAVDEVRPGGTLDPPTVAKDGSFFSVVRDEAGNAIGQFTGTITEEGMRLRQSGLVEAARGQGAGVKAYAELADTALANGKPLLSDSEVTEAAARAYEGLTRRGYTVEQAPEAAWKTMEDGTKRLVNEKGPVFRVTAAPAPGTPPSPVFAPVDEAGKRQVFVNFAKINTAEDIKSVIGQIAEAFPQDIKAAQRGTQSNAQTAALADELGLTVQDVLARQKGQTLNAEQTLAARRLMNTTASQLVDAAKVASSPNATPADLFAFRKLLAVHTAVQAEVLGARTEAARALQAWSIPAEVGNIEMSRNVQSLISSMGGPEATQEIAARLAALQANGATPAGINAFIRASVWARSRDALREAWVNGLLSNPATHIANTSSNFLTAIGQVMERGVAERIAGARGAAAGEGVAPGEALAMMYGITESMRDAFKASWANLKDGSQGPWARPMEERPMAISGQALGIGNDAASRAVDFLGKTVNLPGRFLGAEDEFFKTIAYRMELHAQAVRTAAGEGLTGNAAAARIQQILLSPPENIRLAAVDQALYQTFTNQTGALGQSLMALRSKVPTTAFIMPFVKTPVNISRYAFERSPLAPLVGQWRADIAAGGARADLALARMGTGTIMMLLAMDAAERGQITGGGYYAKDEGEKREALTRQGWQPYSIKVGNKYVSYQRLDPFGMTLGFAADIADVFKRAEIMPDKIDEPSEVLAAGIAAIASTTINKTYMHGAADFFNMMSDPKRNAKQYLDRFTGSFVPASVAATARAVDPTDRQAMTTWDYVMSRLPGLSASLPPKRDLWGAISEDKSGMGPAFNALSPVRVSQTKESPVDAEMERLHIGVKRIDQKGDWDGVPVNFRDWPEVYDQYVKLAGNALEHPAWGVGAKDFLDQVVQNKHVMSTIYQMGSDGEEGGKAGFIKKTVAEYRKLARDAIMQDPKFSEFAEMINREKAKRQEQRMPVGSN